MKKIESIIIVVLLGIAFAWLGLNSERTREILSAMILGTDIISLTNEERVERKIGTLIESPQLTRAAQAKAEDMAKRGYFSHDTPDGLRFTHFIKEAQYDYRFAGENLAVSFDTAEQVTEAWMKSEKHRANVLNARFTEIGVGIAEGVYKGRKAVFVAQEFAEPKVFSILPDSLRSPKILSQTVKTEANSEQKSIVVENAPDFSGIFDLGKGSNLHHAAGNLEEESRVRMFPRILDFMLYLGTLGAK